MPKPLQQDVFLYAQQPQLRGRILQDLQARIFDGHKSDSVPDAVAPEASCDILSEWLQTKASEIDHISSWSEQGL